MKWVTEANDRWRGDWRQVWSTAHVSECSYSCKAGVYARSRDTGSRPWERELRARSLSCLLWWAAVREPSSQWVICLLPFIWNKKKHTTVGRFIRHISAVVVPVTDPFVWNTDAVLTRKLAGVTCPRSARLLVLALHAVPSSVAQQCRRQTHSPL